MRLEDEHIKITDGWEGGGSWKNVDWSPFFEDKTTKSLQNLHRKLSFETANLVISKGDIDLVAPFVEIANPEATYLDVLGSVLAFKASKLHGVEEELVRRKKP